MLKPEDFTVGWICAIPTEYVAAQAFLDKTYDEQLELANIKNEYAFGKIGEHKVVISVLPTGEYGTASASSVAEGMMYTFPNLRVALMVGIGGGAPSRKNDIRLGDVVVSTPSSGHGGVFQYDYGKAIQGRGFQPTGFLGQPPSILHAAVAGLKSSYEIKGHKLDEAIHNALTDLPRLFEKYKRPDPATDRLYRSDIVHKNDDELCDSGCGDDPSHLVIRSPRDEDEDDPAIHYGLIASGNQLMKDAEIRDDFAAQKGILCFEMEAAGLMNHFPCLVIRGICDYSDSHKNKAWQGYAAMVAAAYAKDLLKQIAPQQVYKQKTVAATVKGDTDTHYHMDFGPHNQGLQFGINHGSINGTTFMGPHPSLLNTGSQRLSLSSQSIADTLPQQKNFLVDSSGNSEPFDSSPFQENHEECGMEILVPAASTWSGYRSKENQTTDQPVPPEMDATFHNENPWIQTLFSIGYSAQDVLSLVDEKEKDGPWIFFEPSHVPISDLKIDQHLARCSHHYCSTDYLSSIQISNALTHFTGVGMMNEEYLIEKVEELCGLAGIRPSTRKKCDWVGLSEFRDGNTIVSCRIFKSHLSSVVRRICSAASLLQNHGLCCDSFTILKICSPKQTPETPSIEVVPISFQLIANLDREVSKAERNTVNEGMVFAASKDILQPVLPNIADQATLNGNGGCFRLCALAVQFLSLGLLSYTQAHVGPLRPFFIDTSLREINLLGLAGETIFPCLVSKLVNLTCFGNMTRGAVLAFDVLRSPPNDISSSDTDWQSNPHHDLRGHAEDILDTWGPGTLIFHDQRAGSPVAIKIGDGFISKHETDAKFHWDYELKEPAHAIELSQSLLIGTLVVPNTECQLSEADCRTLSAGVLEYLGASRSSWKKSQRQIALQSGQYAVGQVTETWNKQRGIPIKDVALSNFQDGLIGYLNEYWGLQVSYCTGVARRVPLRKLVADLIPQFLKIATFQCGLQNILKGDHMSLDAFQSWLEGLEAQSRTQVLETIQRILHSLRHTGLDATEKYFCIGWPWDGDTLRCFQFPLEGQSSWARMLADSHDCATFAYITMECFETTGIKCRRLDTDPCYLKHILLLETAVVCPTQTSQAWSLKNGEVYFFSKLDSILWVKVERDHAARTSSLVELAAIMSIPHDIKRRLYVSERKKQRSRLRERSTPLIQGEVVSVFSMRNIS